MPGRGSNVNTPPNSVTLSFSYAKIPLCAPQTLSSSVPYLTLACAPDAGRSVTNICDRLFAHRIRCVLIVCLVLVYLKKNLLQY